MGALAFLSLLGGLAATGMGYYLLGYNGAPLGQIADLSSYQKGLHILTEAGGALVGAGILLVLLDILVSVAGGRGKVAGDDPYEGLTLEWATSSPPPRWGFEAVPEVRSEAPLQYLRQGAGRAGGMPSATTPAALTSEAGS
jgi:cytochrome c oxidase subunit 1